MSTKSCKQTMNGREKNVSTENPAGPQCQFFVQRKKRLCRMTVKPGKNFCGEHEPAPPDVGGQDLRVPCPLDPKHTCYASKLEKHLQVCNSRRGALPEYYEHNVNAATAVTPPPPRLPLTKVPREQLNRVIEKVNRLYKSVVEQEISSAPEQSIHWVVQEEFAAEDRAESSRRHLRQASALLRLCEDEAMVADGTCYVELGAGKGHLSYFAWLAWCSQQPASRALLLDRAALRHKRDNKLRGDRATQSPADRAVQSPADRATPTPQPHADRAAPVRLRADLAHVALQRVPYVAECVRAVGLAKHLCGVATDYALRCMTSEGARHKTRGIVLATCCHHRCERAAYLANDELLELGITGEELDVMLGVVSWATCGDGRSRERRLRDSGAPAAEDGRLMNKGTPVDYEGNSKEQGRPGDEDEDRLTHAEKEEVGRRAKALLDWGRAAALRRRGYRARLARFVPRHVSPEDLAIVAHRDV